MRSKLFFALLLFSFTCAFGKKKLSFQTFSNITYMMRMDDQFIVHSANPDLQPWIPGPQLGWHIPNRELLNQFFQQSDTDGSELYIDFDKYLVVAILKYDYVNWEVSINKVNWDPKAQHLHMTCKSQEQNGPQPGRTLQSMLIAIEKDASFGPLEKIGFSVAEQFSNQYVLHQTEGIDPNFRVFPYAYVRPNPSPKIQVAAIPATPLNDEVDIEDHVTESTSPLPVFASLSTVLPRTSHQVVTETAITGYREKARRIGTIKREMKAEAYQHKRPAPTHISYLTKRGDFPLVEGIAFENLNGFMPKRGLFLGPHNHFVISDLHQWQQVMEPTLPGADSDRIMLAPDFDRHFAVVIVKYGHELWQFETGQAFVSDNDLILNYRSEFRAAKDEWVGASTHVILVERSGFGQLKLMENGKLVKQTTFTYR